MKQYTIKEGNHYSGLRFRPVLFKKRLNFAFSFDESCLYDFGDINQKDVNKLVGFSFGFHHRNSVRLGWRAVDMEKIELLAYVYRKGKLVKEWEEHLYLGLVRPNTQLYGTIEVTRWKYKFTILGDKLSKSTELHRPLLLNPFGYMLYPYFGGDNKAPHDINLKMQIF